MSYPTIDKHIQAAVGFSVKIRWSIDKLKLEKKLDWLSII